MKDNGTLVRSNSELLFINKIIDESYKIPTSADNNMENLSNDEYYKPYSEQASHLFLLSFDKDNIGKFAGETEFERIQNAARKLEFISKYGYKIWHVTKGGFVEPSTGFDTMSELYKKNLAFLGVVKEFIEKEAKSPEEKVSAYALGLSSAGYLGGSYITSNMDELVDAAVCERDSGKKELVNFLAKASEFTQNAYNEHRISFDQLYAVVAAGDLAYNSSQIRCSSFETMQKGAEVIKNLQNINHKLIRSFVEVYQEKLGKKFAESGHVVSQQTLSSVANNKAVLGLVTGYFDNLQSTASEKNHAKLANFVALMNHKAGSEYFFGKLCDEIVSKAVITESKTDTYTTEKLVRGGLFKSDRYVEEKKPKLNVDLKQAGNMEVLITKALDGFENVEALQAQSKIESELKAAEEQAKDEASKKKSSASAKSMLKSKPVVQSASGKEHGNIPGLQTVSDTNDNVQTALAVNDRYTNPSFVSRLFNSVPTISVSFGRAPVAREAVRVPVQNSSFVDRHEEREKSGENKEKQFA